MKKFEGILLCSDLDNTLKDSNGDISQENIEAVKYFTQNGGTFTFASGRPPEYFAELRATFGIKTPVIGLNGSAIYDFEKGKYVYSQKLDPIADECFEHIINNYANYVEHTCIAHEGVTYEYIGTDKNKLVKLFETFKSVIKNEVFFNMKPEMASRFRQEMLKVDAYKSKLDFVRSWPHCVEILPALGNKGGGVKALKEYLGNINKVVCIGDYENDISMVKLADIGYAVSNAIDELKDCADKITVSNNESAIAKIISEL